MSKNHDRRVIVKIPKEVFSKVPKNHEREAVAGLLKAFLEVDTDRIDFLRNQVKIYNKSKESNEKELKELREKKYKYVDRILNNYLITIGSIAKTLSAKPGHNKYGYKNAPFKEEIVLSKERSAEMAQQILTAMSTVVSTSNFEFLDTICGKEVAMKGMKEYETDTNEFKKNIPLLLSKKYKLPDDPWRVLSQLKTISLYYAIVPYDVPAIIDLKIDFSMLRLVRSLDFLIEKIKRKGTDIDRIFKSIKGKQEPKADRMQKVIEEYYRIPNRDGVSRNKIATIILEHLKKTMQSPPSIKTITRYLKEEGLPKQTNVMPDQ